MEMAKSSPKDLKTLWEKEKIARNEKFLLFPQCFQKKTLWEKERIARNEQFLLFPQCFQKTYITDT